ncbi:MAG TPA: sialate O-acetylesterase [Armatimonadota bacterium]|nr:sialate O-acetylesterase [Armatimonadota bacterium]
MQIITKVQRCSWLIVCLVLAMFSTFAMAQNQTGKPFLHPLFCDNMVLQRDLADPIWGWTEAGKVVTVAMNGKTAKATADADGKWMAKIGPFKAGGPFTLTVSGSQTVTLKNVMVGDVWICSGQSNMQMGIGIAGNAQQEIANANYPNIRLFSVPNTIAYEPMQTVNSQWQICTPQSIATAGSWGGFSAAGYYFGRYLHQQLNVPIGLIHTSWGGTIAEAWTSKEALQTMPDFQTPLAQFAQFVEDQKQASYNFSDRINEWYKKNDIGSTDWGTPTFDDTAWKTAAQPQLWEQNILPNFDGIVWFRKEINLPADWSGKDAVLHLGTIDDFDTTMVNGVQVGSTYAYNQPRNYKIAGSILKPGKNIIAVRVLDTGGGGGFYGDPALMKLEVAGAPQIAPIALNGNWKYQVSANLAKLPSPPQQLSKNPNVTTVLYNGMIAPLVPFGIKGAIWYQGESNASRGKQYQTLLPTMINDWRTRFGVGDFPFLVVQLANYMDTPAQPVESAWAELREAQTLTAKRMKNVGLAVTIDIGDPKDIHPKNKQEVGRRLGLAALAIAYGQKLEYSGPIYRSMEVKGNTIRVSFDHLGGGLVAKDNEKLIGFAIAGADKKFVWADAVIDGDTVVVSSPQISNPVAVRYAWGNSPLCNLYNKAGLPASPFRTDIAK